MNNFFKKAVFVALILAPAFTGCQKDVVNNHEPDPEGRVTLTVSVPIDETKVYSDGDEALINNIQVFLFDEDGVIEDYVTQSTPDIKLSASMGRKTLIVLVNAPDYSNIHELQTLLGKSSLLVDNAVNSFVMEGQKILDIMSTNAFAITVPVTRKVAKVKLNSLNVAIDIPQYSSLPFKVSSVYLINVPAEMPYFQTVTPLSWLNKQMLVPEDDHALIYDDMNDFQVTEDTPYQTQNVFYCYPNNVSNDSFSSDWTPRNTRLVVEALIGDKTYYYPVTLPTLKMNMIYNVNLTITRLGAESPDSKIELCNSGFEISVESWGQGGTINEQV